MDRWSQFVRPNLVGLLVVAMAVIAAGVPAGAQPAPPPVSAPPPASVSYLAPVDAEVVDGFRPPESRFGPGHRGIEFGTAAGVPVRASAAGTVTFAGPVASRSWVTIGHADGLRTTYGPMATVAVGAGQAVAQGDVLGTTAGPLLFTARVGDAYVDPAVLLGRPSRVRLVPVGDGLAGADAALLFPAPTSASGGVSPEVLLRGFAWLAGGATDLAGGAMEMVTPLAEFLPSLLRVTQASSPLALAGAAFDWWARRRRCTPAAVLPPPPAGRRVAVLVGGLGSSSGTAAIDGIDTEALGYAAGDRLRFSYRGGRTPGPVSADLATVAANAYETADTQDDLEAAGRRLADLLRDVSGALGPGVPVDVLAHSQGGIVARLALRELARRSPGTLERLGLVVTMGSPHRGADLAGAITAVADQALPGLVLETVQAMAGSGIEPDAVAVGQLAPGSPLLEQLAVDGLPAGVPVLSLAARGDAVVAAPRARLDGARNVTIGVEGVDDHSALPGAAAAAREIALARAGLGAGCESALDALGDVVVPALVGAVGGTVRLAAELTGPIP
ncbi:MAG: peptidoglycan DD-metalloendopeptidase family protein [Acidimicrobiia bacterium]